VANNGFWQKNDFQITRYNQPLPKTQAEDNKVSILKIILKIVETLVISLYKHAPTEKRCIKE